MRVYIAEGMIYIPSKSVLIHKYDVLPTKGRTLLVSFNSMYMTKKYQYIIPATLAMLTLYVHVRNSSLLGVNLDFEKLVNELKLIKIEPEELTWLEYFISSRCILASSVVVNNIAVSYRRSKTLQLILEKLSNKEIQEYLCSGNEIIEVLKEVESVVQSKAS